MLGRKLVASPAYAPLEQTLIQQIEIWSTPAATAVRWRFVFRRLLNIG